MWARIRDRRRRLQDTPLAKGSTGRCDSISAGLAQFEEQMTAARAVSVVTRPINLFYALEQAGLAIAAAHAQGEYWFSSHGLKVVDLNADLCDMKVRVDAKQTRGAYGIVSKAVSSGVIESEVSVGALWASLPDLTFARLPGDYPRVTRIIPNMPFEPWTGNSVGINFLSTATPTNAMIYFDLSHTPDEATDEWLQRVLESYPGTEDCVLYREAAGSGSAVEAGTSALSVKISWPYSGKNLTRAETRKFFDEFAPAYRYELDRYLRPSVEGDGKKAPSPLMTWWLLLYVLSMVSRYRPGQWNKLLDLDKSEYAVSLDYALQEAISVLPHLVLEGLDDGPWLLRKPMMMIDS